MVRNKVLIIEGTTDTRNGDLRQGFHKLLAQELEGKVPQIIMGDGKKQAIKKFLNFQSQKFPDLLIDLDKEEFRKEEDLKSNNLLQQSKNVYFMIQEMEAWFLSQPDVLNKYYNTILKVPKKPPQEIINPADVLYTISENTRKGKYHKVVHAVDLLQQLDATKLMDDFDDFKILINTLKK